jgi:Dihydrodipicolinate synthetase family
MQTRAFGPYLAAMNRILISLVGWPSARLTPRAETARRLFCEPNPIPVNTALAMCGLVQPVFRLPYVPLSREQREVGAALLEAVKDHIPGCERVRVMEDDEFVLVGTY